MQERLLLPVDGGLSCMTDALSAMQRAAVAHSLALRIDRERMLADFGALWMLARCAVRLSALPAEPVRVETFLRPPGAAVSCRDFTFYCGQTPIGTAVHSWVLVDAETRRLLRLDGIAPLHALPVPLPPRTSQPGRVKLGAPLTARASWQISPQEIDENGHLNHVHYLRRAAPLVCAQHSASAPPNALDICYDRECFAGETLLLQSAPGGYVRGEKADGSESFRLRLWRQEP